MRWQDRHTSWFRRAVRPGRVLRGLGREERGTAAAEFALLITPLMVIMFGIVQFGLAFSVYNTMTDAARRAARAVAVQGEAPGNAGTIAQNSLQSWGHTQFSVDTEVAPDGRVTVRISTGLSEAALINPVGLIPDDAQLSTRVVMRRLPGAGGGS
ncbi:TadE-like protein [Limimonas halophila]|uniref:TadE-like protein n=1 Tax=Limimonas halophila TaxID=1082479 RepID=A0A1G7RCY1_9PROT|nr:TadE family protein [Limimonas halophila]SDG08514.1 TadE-like protein [Limimonas halophila]